MDSRNSSYLTEEQGYFIVYTNSDYIENLRKTLSDILSDIIEYQFIDTPKYRDESVYKLHVSLSKESYTIVKEDVIAIILKYLSECAINSFKHTDDDLLSSSLNEYTKLLELLLEYESFTERPTNKWIYDYMTFAKPLVGDAAGKIEDKTFARQLITSVENIITDLNRFLHSDQFTLYLPSTFQKEIIIKMCNEINNYLLTKKATKGDIFEVESPIGDFINLRQEYLLDDFDQAKKTGDVSKRINTGSNKIDEETKKKVVSEQESSELYQSLKKSIGPNQTPLRFFNKANYSRTHSISQDSNNKPSP